MILLWVFSCTEIIGLITVLAVLAVLVVSALAIIVPICWWRRRDRNPPNDDQSGRCINAQLCKELSFIALCCYLQNRLLNEAILHLPTVS